MTVEHAASSPAGTPTPTSALRCAMALNMLQQRAHDDRLVELLCAVLRGVTLGELVDLELNR